MVVHRARYSVRVVNGYPATFGSSWSIPGGERSFLAGDALCSDLEKMGEMTPRTEFESVSTA